MPERNPLITVLIASYNYEHYIAETIRSIWTQPYGNLEIVVVDDCSTDDSVDLLTNLQQHSPVPMFLYVNERNLGPALTCNRAISHAKGELLTFLGSDDLFVEDRFTRQVELFRQNKELQIVYGNGFRLENGKIKGFVHGDRARELLSRKADQILEYLYTNSNPLFTQTALMKRELINNIGGLDPSALADDWVLNTNIFRYLVTHGGEYGYLDEPLFLYRIHDSNLHTNVLRQSRLKLDFIEKQTPEHLKKQARANIVYGLAFQAMQIGDFKAALDYFQQSRQGGMVSAKVIRFWRKLIVAVAHAPLTTSINKIRSLFSQFQIRG
jgi:glycosyltransferase involved in cell wall biosynthesis